MLRKHGLSPLEVMSPSPEWAMTDASLPLPADLRHAYRYARRPAADRPAADRPAADRPAAIQLSNEPDMDVTSSTGDAHAAFVKAAARGPERGPQQGQRGRGTPAGYRLSRRTRMSLDVYNFTATPRTVTVKAPRPAGGWSARAEGPTRVEVSPQGRTTVPFTITAGSAVKCRTDHRLAFTATLDGDEVPPSVSLVQLK
ncbi:hypothetical protein [Streptomyces sp. NBC_00878]|uniref:hypothetical protein n=1 Tax=Streptomyces sp. NBC_00878 TaxID=2975854 RepID=UPI00225AB8F4|nr:hypothetical protein [Streptomyces sp. NBC_00878]MCX4906158.1 hypothetical protein [Streptomyces sp. NBC_00878]